MLVEFEWEPVRIISSLEFVESGEHRVQGWNKHRNQISYQLPRRIRLVWIFVALLCDRFCFLGIQGKFIFGNKSLSASKTCGGV
jgi:hypothetical protein